MKPFSILCLVSCVLPLLSIFFYSCYKDTSPIILLQESSDTTSHNFSWEIDTIGTNSSYLLDVAIIDENNIWAVGEIHTAETDTFDSLGNWIPPYNVVHWNGQEWELNRLLYKNGFWTIHSIFAFNESDIWFEYAIHWDGNYFRQLEFPDFRTSANKIWGTSSQDVYIIGNNGLIGYYNGTSWQKLESGTDVDIRDIWGAKHAQTGDYEILAIASSGFNVQQEKKLLNIQGTNITSIIDDGLPFNLSSIWFVPNEKYFITGDGVFYTKEIGKFWKADSGHPLIYKEEIRGNGVNDIFITGSFGLVSHYNGVSWHHYTGNELPTIYGGYHAISLYSNMIVAVGDVDDNAIILRGYTN